MSSHEAAAPQVGTGRAWYVARTKARQEQQTAAVLGQRGIDSYLPTIVPSRRWHLDARPELLFPGYLFARLRVETDWRRARYAPGVAYFLGGDGIPTEVPDELVEEIRARVARQRDGWQRRYVRGDRVRIVGGALDGLEAIFDEGRSGAKRSLILVQVVSRLVRVEIESARLCPVG